MSTARVGPSRASGSAPPNSAGRRIRVSSVPLGSNVVESDIETIGAVAATTHGHGSGKARRSSGAAYSGNAIAARPDEPCVDLKLLRESQLKAMMTWGKQDAEEARVESGFFGGSSPMMVFIFGFVAAGLAGVVVVYRTLSVALDPDPEFSRYPALAANETVCDHTTVTRPRGLQNARLADSG